MPSAPVFDLPCYTRCNSSHGKTLLVDEKVLINPGYCLFGRVNTFSFYIYSLLFIEQLHFVIWLSWIVVNAPFFFWSKKTAAELNHQFPYKCKINKWNNSIWLPNKWKTFSNISWTRSNWLIRMNSMSVVRSNFDIIIIQKLDTILQIDWNLMHSSHL